METAATQQTTEQTEVDERLYRFDEQELFIAINARPDAETPRIVTYKFRKATFDELSEWTKNAAYETAEVNKRETEIRSNDAQANIKLFKKIVLAVKGNFGDGQPVTDFRDLTEEQKERVKVDHKVAAVRGLYSSVCEVVEDKEDEEAEPCIFGGDLWRIKQTIGEKYVIVHTLREPDEKEKLKFGNIRTNTTYQPGSRTQRSKTRTNLKAYVDLYNTLIQDIEGGTVGGFLLKDERVPRPKFLEQVDPIFKQLVVQKLTSAIEAEYQD
jgi:hypothetical protein